MLAAQELSDRIRDISSAVRDQAASIELLLVTNLRNGDLIDVGPAGVVNAGQYYSRREADEIIRRFQDLGVTVLPFFSETEFLHALTTELHPTTRARVVFTTAEGGTGVGRRALIPAACNLAGLPCMNSGSHASSIARHKFHANAVLKRVGVRVPETWMFQSTGWLAGSAPAPGTRVILKPMFESMCIGVGEDAVAVVDASFDGIVTKRLERFGQPVLVQEFITGEEIGVPLLRIGAVYALPPVTFRRQDGSRFLDRPRTFQEEVVDRSVTIGAFEGDPSAVSVLQTSAQLAFDALGMKGAARVDFRVDADGRAWAFDTNESPPPLPATSWAVSIAELGFDIEDMLATWLGVCLLESGQLSGV